MFEFFLQNPINDSVKNLVDTAAKVVNGITTRAANEPKEFTFSVFSMIEKGGPMMIPIGFLLVLALYVLIERLIVTNKASKKNANLLVSVKELVSKGNIDSARAMCNSMPTPE